MKKIIVLVLCLACTLPVFATDLIDMTRAGNTEGAKKAIQGGADVNAVDADGMTAFAYAIVSKIENPDQDYEILELLLKAGVDINQEFEGYDNEIMTPLSFSFMAELDFAVSDEDMLNTRYDVAIWLIKHGADANNVRIEGFPIFYVPVMTGSPEILALMISSGLRVNARSEEGYNALSFLLSQYEYASDEFTMTEGHYEVFRQLVKAGLDVNAWDEDGMNALLYAARSLDAKMVRFLLESGADAKLFNPDGESAFDYARSNNALINTDEYWLLCDAHYEAIDNHMNTMQPYIIMGFY